MQDQQVLVSYQQALNAFQHELPIQLGRAAVDGADQPVDEYPVPALAPQQQAGQSVLPCCCVNFTLCLVSCCSEYAFSEIFNRNFLVNMQARYFFQHLICGFKG
jgi:hypothetical protein